MTPILIGDCDSPGTVRPASATRSRATKTDRLPIESLLRDRDVPARIAHDLTGGKRVYSRVAGRAMGAKFFGAAVKRREDPRFLRGEGRFIDDVVVPGMLHAAFVRSPHAHALVRKIHTEAAGAAPGVARVFTFADLDRWMKPLPLFGAAPAGLGAVVKFDVRQTPQWALCRHRARYVGEIVAMVVADSPERAQDAADLIQVDWESQPVV